MHEAMVSTLPTTRRALPPFHFSHFEHSAKANTSTPRRKMIKALKGREVVLMCGRRPNNAGVAHK